MLRFLKGKSFKIFITVIAILVAGTICSAVMHSNSSPITSAFATVIQPLQRLSSMLSNSLSSFSIYFRSASVLNGEVNDLREKIAEYESKLSDYEQSKQKVKLYEEFLGIKEAHPDYEFVSGTVIGRDSADNFSGFTLNKGSLKGISVNDPVLYGIYLVGVVTKVSPTQCVVSTLLNPSVNAAVYEVSTRETGFVETTPELSKKGLCRFPGLERTTSIAPGGIVSTVGTGGVFPKDLIIGTVKEVVNDSTDITTSALIEPGVDYSKLIDVFILVNFEGQSNADD